MMQALVLGERPQSLGEEIANSVSHGLGLLAALAAFQVLDHSAIYFLIAGTYTPFTLGVLRGA